MKLEHDKESVNSFLGSCLSVLLFFVVLIYGLQKTQVWLTKSQNIVMMSTFQNAIDSEEIFGSRDNQLHFAIGFTAYDNEEEPILDKSIGELVFNAYRWGEYSNGTYFTEVEPLNTHTCSEEELGLV